MDNKIHVDIIMTFFNGLKEECESHTNCTEGCEFFDSKESRCLLYRMPWDYDMSKIKTACIDIIERESKEGD